MQKEGRTHGGTCPWRRYTNEETTKQRNIEIEGTYTRGGHTHGEVIHTERTFTRKGHTHGEDMRGGDMHTEGKCT